MSELCFCIILIFYIKLTHLKEIICWGLYIKMTQLSF